MFHGIAVCALMVGIAFDAELLALVTFAILIMFIWVALYSGYQVIKLLIQPKCVIRRGLKAA